LRGLIFHAKNPKRLRRSLKLVLSVRGKERRTKSASFRLAEEAPFFPPERLIFEYYSTMEPRFVNELKQKRGLFSPVTSFIAIPEGACEYPQTRLRKRRIKK
jgi:hypothetical protein